MSELYKKTYRVLMIDQHFPDAPYVTFDKFSAREQLKKCVEARIDSIHITTKCHWGYSYYNTEVEELLQEAKTLPGCDQGERAVLYKQIQEYIYDEQPYDFLYATRAAWAYNQRVGGANPGGWSLWHNVHEWYIKSE